jgi:hypothetical protein
LRNAIVVHHDYATAFQTARKSRKMLVVDFGAKVDFSQIRQRALRGYVLCQVPVSATVQTEDGTEVKLLDHPAFADLEGRPGVAIIDFKHADHRQMVVSVLPERHVNPEHVEALLRLPKGSLTQRTLVWALLIHPEQPQSVLGEAEPQLVAHAERHSTVQANENYQHHNLPIAIAVSEIVAESWPWNHNVVDAAIDIVHSWRQSPGHWGAACRAYQYFGYDMKWNGNKWFATGVFR